ncbi:hypothetical protein GCM10027217_13420 [Pseudomaricurvus hydrocarbonicus]
MLLWAKFGLDTPVQLYGTIVLIGDGYPSDLGNNRKISAGLGRPQQARLVLPGSKSTAEVPADAFGTATYCVQFETEKALHHIRKTR